MIEMLYLARMEKCLMGTWPIEILDEFVLTVAFLQFREYITYFDVSYCYMHIKHELLEYRPISYITNTRQQ